MEKRILFMLTFLMSVLTGYAQFEKGDWSLNGPNIVSFQSGTQKVNYGTFDSETKYSSFSVGPFGMTSNLSFANALNLNNSFTNQLSGGILMLFSTISEKDNGDKGKMSYFMIGPSLRYYMSRDKKFLPFLEGKAGIGSIKYDSDDADKYKLSGWYAGSGATYFFVPKVGIDITIGYQSFMNKSKESESDFKGTTNGIAFGIGVLVAF